MKALLWVTAVFVGGVVALTVFGLVHDWLRRHDDRPSRIATKYGPVKRDE